MTADIRQQACGYDSCDQPGYCDGRHCAAANGAIRLTPEEMIRPKRHEAEWDLAEATAENASFSKDLPGLQVAVDSTSLGAFKKCPRYYFYSIILGFRSRTESVHLTFGIWMHEGLERYHHARAEGTEHEQAVLSTVRWALGRSWDSRIGRPISLDSPEKNRLTFLRSLVWYLDRWGHQDPTETIRLANGKPAVELSFSFPLGRSTRSTGEEQLYCGHMDRLCRFNDSVYVHDTKSTKSALGPFWANSFTPDGQFSGYVLAGKIALAEPVAGLILDGVQVAAGFSIFERFLVTRSDSQSEEFLQDTIHWLGIMESSAEEGVWPLNEKGCGLYGGCEFRTVCARAPGARKAWLEADFAKRLWDPLQRRGDI